MKKKVTTRSAFFNPRALFGAALCLLALALAFIAVDGITTNTVQAQNPPPRRATTATVRPQAVPEAPTILAPVHAVLSIPLRDMPIVAPDNAPGREHPEPINPMKAKLGAVDEAIQTIAGRIESAPNPTGLNFDGIGIGFGNYSPNVNPPDVNGRVGTTQYVQWNNSHFTVFNKTTGAALTGAVAGNTFFKALGGACSTHNDGDPVVTFDLLSGRWVLSQFVVGAGAGSFSHQCFAISQTEDATGAYYLYDFLTDANNFVDYPHTGTWPDGYYMSAHVFNAAGTAYIVGRIYVFERSQMLVGGPARMVSANLAPGTGGGQQYGFLPADLDSQTPPPAGEAEFVMGPDPDIPTLATSARVAVTWGASPTIAVTQSTVTVLPYSDAPCVGATPGQAGRNCVPQPAPATTADYVDAIGGHFMYRLAYRNNGSQANPQESLLANETVAGSDAMHGGIRWYEFRNSGSSTSQPTVFQQSTYDPDTNYRWLGSIAMDNSGDIALGFSESSTTIKPSIFVTGRLASDAVNTMGTEVNMLTGTGVQIAAGNRWGDYSAMTLDPIDQCTFYYTNEYLKANGSFNWSTRIASFKFPSCVNAPAWGTVSGNVTSAQTGAPLSGVTVTLTNGFAGATDASGNYTILAPPGSYNASAADPVRNCSYASPDTVPVFVTSGGTTNQNFTISGNSKLDVTGFSIDDSSTGNNNGIVNKAECVKLNVGLKNNGCATESAVSATLTTTTPGVTVLDSSSTYPDMLIDASGTNASPFRFSVDPSFVCGTNITFSLNLTYANGNKTVQFTVPSCAGGPNQTIPSYQLSTSDATQPDRVGRNGVPSTCSGKASPGGGFTSTGPHFYKTFSFTNDGGAAACFTVTINAGTGGPGDIESAAYLNTYDPNNVSTNYLGDSGITGLGTTVGSVSYSFTVPALSNFIVVVETSGKAVDASNKASSVFSGTVSGFFNQSAGPGVCPAAPAAPVLSSAASRVNNLDTPVALSGPISTEPRNGGGNYTLVLNFNTALQSGAASVVAGTGSAGTPVFNGNSMLIPLSGVSDLQRLTLRATNVTSTGGASLGSAEVTLGFIVGDTNGDGAVNAADIGQTKAQSGAPITASNCREDLNADSAINAADISLAKSRSGTALP